MPAPARLHARSDRRRAVALAAAAVLGVAGAPPAQAASCSWNGSVGNWSDISKWLGCVTGSGSPAGTPGLADAASIGSGVVTINSAQSVGSLTNAAALHIDAAALTLAGSGGTVNTGTINVGAGPSPNNAVLQIGNNHNVTNTGGVINVSADSVINQSGSTISGGTLATTGTGKLIAAASSANFLDALTLNGTLDLAGAYGFERISGGLTLNGTVLVGQASIFAPQGAQTIGGSGTIVFADGNASNRFNTEAGTLTLGSGITVRGNTGTIGGQSFVGGAATLVNQGVIAADVAGGTIVVNVNSGVTNQGTMAGRNGGVLRLDGSGSGYANSGTLGADNAGVLLLNGATVNGGTLATASGGRIVSANNPNNMLVGTTLAGVIDTAGAVGITRVSGGMTLSSGTIQIGQGSIFAPQGDQTIGGSGTIVFADGNASNRLNTEAGNLTLGPGVTVRGQSGLIGAQNFVGGAATLTNHGTIESDVAGGAVVLQVNGGVTNTGTLAALNGGSLIIRSNVAGLAGSQILAGAGSTVVQDGVTLTGAINVSGGGNFAPSANGNNFLDGVALSGAVDLASAYGIERVVNGLTLNGSLQLAQGSIFAPQGDQTIGGSGTIVFADGNGSNRLNTEAGNLTLGPGVTVRGQSGSIGGQNFVGGAATLTNHGTIQADVAGGTINLQVNGGVTNTGTLAALNGGTLVLHSNVLGMAGSQIHAGPGSAVVQDGVTLSGAINVSGGGAFRPSASGANFLDGVAFSGAVDLAGAYGIERVVNGLTLNGSMRIGQASVFAPQGDQTIGGSGTIVFADGNSSNRFNTEAGNLTLGSGVMVRGESGVIGQQNFVGGPATLTNNGIVQADVAGGTITLGVNGGVFNHNLLAARNGGTLVLSSQVDNSAGSMLADTGSAIVQNGVTILGGTLSGAGRYVPVASGANFLDGATLNGTLDLAGAYGIERLVNGLTVNGSVQIGQASIFAPQGNQTIGGSGSIVFADGNPANRFNVEAGNLVIGPGVTVHGNTGIIGQQLFVGGGASLTNQGTLASDGGGTITVTISGSLVNHGLMRAQNGALVLNTPLSGTGTLQVDSAGAMALANGGNAQGQLVMGAAGSAISLGSGNLVIGTDYTNVGAGSGNAYNRRAGVSGGGQIVAGGDVAQVITGADVSGGNTTNATLTIHHVRVGSTTFNYQIGNAGSTGPTLRGAIQTAANGGNITDPRLSGAGVTAANFNAGAPGGSTGDLGVTFTAASAGPLAALSGQVLNLRSNFENIADQKLNIVLGSGAAAYQAAAGQATPAPVVIGNQRIGGSLTQALTLANTATGPAGYVEDLNAAFTGATGQAQHNGGSVSGLWAGHSQTGAMSVGLDTTTEGARSGTVTVKYQTTGTVAGVSNGLGVADANAPQVIGVSGNVYKPAQGQIVTPAWNFGTLQVGQTIQQDLVLRNSANGAAGFVEDLNASFGAASGNGFATISGAGTLGGIQSQHNSTAGNGAMTVSVTGGSVGAFSGNILVNYQTAGQVAGVSNGLGTAPAGSDPYGVSGSIVTGTVVNQASPLVNTPTINLGAVRVGGAFGPAAVSVTNVATAPPQAALNASIAPSGGPATAAGSFNLLLPGATDASSLGVGMNTATAGNYTGGAAGQATISFVSDASNIGSCAPSCTLDLAPQVVRVEGKVYAPAIGQTPTAALNFGVVRVGDTVSARDIVIHNAAAIAGLNDTLHASTSALAGPFTGGGSVSGIAAQGNGAIAVGLDTTHAGVYSQSATVGFKSQNPDMADIAAAADASVGLSAQVNNLANADFERLAGAGTLTHVGTDYTLDLGTVAVGTSLSAWLEIQNDVAGPADVLSGSFDLSFADDFTLTGWDPVAGLDAGQAQGGLQMAWLAGTAGAYSDTIFFHGLGTNASDPVGLAQTRTLRIVAYVVGTGDVPEPGTLALLMAAAAAAWVARSSPRPRRAAAGRA